MVRAWFAIVAALSVVLTLAGCHGGDDGGWHPSAQVAPSLRPTFGARVTDDKLQIMIGPGCSYVTKLTLWFDGYDPKLVLTSLDPQGVKVDRFTFGGPYPGLRVTTALPESFDWRTAKELSIEVLSAPGGFPGTANMSDVVNDSPKHPADTYWFQGVGWLTETEATAQDGKAFLAPCTPDPGKK